MKTRTTAFPDDGLYSDDRLLRAYEAGPGRLESATESLEHEHCLARPRGALTWSVQEIVLHVVDSEILAAFRLGKILAEPGSAIPVYDEVLWTQVLGHQASGSERLFRALTLFRELRAAILPRFSLENLQGDAFGVHPKFGPITVRNLLQLYADHSERHIEQIYAIRAHLGVSTPFATLLEKRLY